MDTDTHGSGTLDEALQRLHRSGPERNDWLSNHAPMAVEALVRNGHAASVHRWLDGYEAKLEEMPRASTRVTDADWQEALGDPRRLADWIAYFERTLEERPWREVLAEWWPRLLPGIPAAATHGVIRVGHAVRTLLAAEANQSAGTGAAATASPPRLAELAHALGYWAGRHAPLPSVRLMPAEASTAAGLAAVPPAGSQEGGIRERLSSLTALPARPGPGGADPAPAQVREALEDLVRAATHRYATHAHGSPVMLVHSATAPNAVLRTLPALPERLWLPSLDAAWSAATAVTAAYTPATPLPPPLVHAGLTAEEIFERAAAHGDEHAIKLADTAVDVAVMDAEAGVVTGGDPGGGESAAPALAAALRALGSIDPAG